MIEFKKKYCKLASKLDSKYCKNGKKKLNKKKTKRKIMK